MKHVHTISRIFLFALLALSTRTHAQLDAAWIFRDARSMPIYEATTEPNKHIHTAIRPLSSTDSASSTSVRPSWRDRLFDTDALVIRDKSSVVRINPAINFGAGFDPLREDVCLQNTRGVHVDGRFGKKIYFYSAFFENQTRFYNYVRSFIGQNRVIPSEGLNRGFGAGYSDYYWAQGMIEFRPDDRSRLFLGHGRPFIGEGYRSMLLSDNAFNYFHFGGSAKIGPLEYLVFFPFLNDLNRDLEINGSFRKKYQAIHYLSYNITKRLNVGLFEAITYGDTSRAVQSQFEFNYLNPIIFYRPVEYAQGSERGNAIVGMQASFWFHKAAKIYGQLALDEFRISEIRAGNGWWANKWGIQLGLKGYDVIVPGLHYRIEYNEARPFMYSHKLVLLNYGHFNQSMAHPLGANFRETVAILQYDRNRWQMRLQMNYAVQGMDSAGLNFGSDIYESYDTRADEYGNYTGRGEVRRLLWMDASVSYEVNPAWNTVFKVGVIARKEEYDNPDLNANPDWNIIPYVALRHQLFNQYLDF